MNINIHTHLQKPGFSKVLQTVCRKQAEIEDHTAIQDFTLQRYVYTVTGGIWFVSQSPDQDSLKLVSK